MRSSLAWLLCAGLASCGTAEVASRRSGDVPYEELDRESRILGKTHRPLGETVTIQGTLVQGPFKGFEGGPNLVIQRVNGVATQEGAQIALHPYWDKKVVHSLVRGHAYELRGYESGRYMGVPSEAYREAGEAIQTTGFYFLVDFTVISSREIPAIRFGPADFVDRFAVIEGTAATVGGQGWLVGPEFRLLVREGAPWLSYEVGRWVEAEGSMRSSSTAGEYRIENGRSRLVDLHDQLGRDVELRGMALSLNGHWWLDYRGTSLYVDDLEKLPGWTHNQHGAMAVITGVLERAMLPDLEQITLKSDPDKKEYYIVRRASWRPAPDRPVR